MNEITELLSKSDFKDMIRIFNEEKVQFIVIGGTAVIIYGYTRLTKDLDLWVWANPANAIRIVKALEKFGAPMHEITAEDFEKEGTIFQIGVAPIRIDIITATVGVKFEEAFRNIENIEADGINIPLISISDLIENKKATGRPQDLIDVEHLEAILKRKKGIGKKA
ncbi:MAG: nucleotidyl transferase AbiEii/AbiGii toxin family protein [Chitinispirillales bacterium]|jgi:predicted nucleotidyltransferase|nr:nucleotidyl transferase AbiEii/AbiGii toxin family protein [Chitinispirillales bacterium]